MTQTPIVFTSPITVEIDNGDGVLYIKVDQDLIVGILLDDDILESVPESITDAPNGTLLGTENGRSGKVTLYDDRFIITETNTEKTYMLPRNFRQKITEACDDF